ncbi:hypothetical protein HPB50_009950 [Hyalomma asiaticum]|uniref:Uncharacterized protein n=1 Tax=Hyalomma asiaticum TaxID=266040 RepID=A0ACB7THJ8_HYAAI|nr:hypothetical protein HPB50_009950 [Hyalomma asiaticum]
MVEALRSTLSTEQRGKYLVSVVEEELEAAVLTESQKPLCCLWMERRFTHRGPQRSNSVVGTLVENAEGTGPIDISDSKRYNLVRAQLEDRLPESQKLVLRVKWSKEGPNTEENTEYFDELSTTLSRDLKAMVDTVVEEDGNDETTRPCRGIEQQLYVELVQQAQVCLSLSESFIGQTETLVHLEKYLRSKLRHPLVLHGVKGSGKSTLVAKVAQLCETWVPDAPVIVRFVGASPDSDTQQQLLRSICEQCCALYGMHTIFASKSISEQREVLGVLLDKVSSHRPLIILLDGLDQVAKHSAYTFDWLPSELPPYVKVVLTVRDGSKELEDLKGKEVIALHRLRLASRPVSDYLREPSKEPASAAVHEEEKARTLGQLYTIKGDASHMVSLNRSDLLVWDVFGESIVRRLTGLSEPRDLKMVDRFRALVLCNRELKVYSLDEGRLLVKLKGVMNQKMAYFGLHSQDYVVALSRNRMYVNMLNLSSGDLETTFKVGEDRFLNSLLVSGNGKICELSDSAPNFIIVYDLQSGTLFKKWKPERNSCSIAISAQGGCVVNGLDNCFVLVWDLATGARRYTLKGHNAPIDQIRLDESGFKSLTYNSDGIDRSVRVWDVMKGKFC